jgi:RHS repeat-associated protein
LVTNTYTTSADAPTPTGWVKKQTHADGGTFQFAYTVNSGKSTSTDVTDPRGYVRRVTFNTAGYSTTEIRAYQQPEQQIRSWDRPGSDNFVATFTDALLAKTTYVRDAFGNVTSLTRCKPDPNQGPCSDTTTGALTTLYTYNPSFQQIATVTDPLNHTATYGYDNSGNLTSITDALQHQTTLGYNGQGQVTSVTDGLQHTTSFGYTNGDLTIVTDPLNRVTRRFADAGGRLLRLTNPLGQATLYTYDRNNQVLSVTDSVANQTVFAYFPDGQLQALTDANQHATNYTFDVMGRLATRTDPLQRVESFAYDLNGNAATWTDRRGQITTRTYDALNRPHIIDYADGSAITYTFDSRNRVTQIDDNESGATQSIVRGYDDFDRVQSETTPLGSIGYTYDDAGRRQTMTASGQSQVVYTFDDADRLSGVTSGSVSVGITYDDANRRSTLTLPNGIVATYSYDEADQLTSLTYRDGAATVGDVSYAYDSAGRRTQIGGSLGRTGLPPTAVATYNGANELTLWGAHQLSYDANGNLASDGLTSYTWNARNQLVGETGQTGASFAYDALGRRRSKVVNGATTQFLYDGSNFIQEQSSTGTSNLLTGIGVDELFARTDSAGTTTPLVDALGSTLELTDASGTLLTHYTYESFGATATSGSSSVNTQQFAGREDDATGQYFNRARYYNARLQRFVSEDPTDFGGGLNLYAYANNRPLDFTDPTGLDPLRQFCENVRQKIDNIRKDIEKREAEYEADAQNLPESCSDDALKPSTSRRGHRRLISDLKADLAVWEILNSLFCGGNSTPGSPRLLPEIPAIPAPPPATPQQRVVIAGAAGTAIVTYWWVIVFGF